MLAPVLLTQELPELRGTSPPGPFLVLRGEDGTWTLQGGAPPGRGRFSPLYSSSLSLWLGAQLIHTCSIHEFALSTNDLPGYLNFG